MKPIGFDTNRAYKWLLATFFALLALSSEAQNLTQGDVLSLDPEPVTGRSYGAVTSIALSPSDGSLWIGTKEEGILRIGRNGNRIRYTVQSNHLLSDNISELCFVSPSLLYVLYDDGRVSRYSSTEGYTHHQFIDAPVSHIMPGFEIGQLVLVDKRGKILKIEENGSNALIGDLNEPVSAVAISNDKMLYAAGSNSRVVYSVSGGRNERVTAPTEDILSSLVVVEGGDIWAGTGQGLYWWRDGSWIRLSTADGLVSNRVYDLVFDGGDQLFVSTYRGIEAINVSNPKVTNPKVYFSGQSFLCSTVPAGIHDLLIFGGESEIASISSKTDATVIPWNDTSAVPDPKKNNRFILFALLALLSIVVGFIAGRFSLKKEEQNEGSSTVSTEQTGVEGNSTISYEVTHSTPVSSSFTSSPDSHEDVFKAISKLTSGQAPDFSLKVWQMIENSYSEKEFSVESIASRLLLSRVHLNRKLQQEIGVSPSALLKAQRMSSARNLMLKGGLSIQQIAQITGFSSAAFLSTSFKEYFGQSPSELMRSS